MLRGTPFTRLQGQYLAFIDLYTKLHRRAPAEADMQAYFKVTAPSVHRMVVALAKRGLVARIPGQSRAIKILVPQNQLPELE